MLADPLFYFWVIVYFLLTSLIVLNIIKRSVQYLQEIYDLYCFLDCYKIIKFECKSHKVVLQRWGKKIMSLA